MSHDLQPEIVTLKSQISDLKSQISNLKSLSSGPFGHWSLVIGHSRAGLTLLEVLFAIFVAAVGLLGLAALLTIGGVHTSQSERADRSAAAARAAFRDIEARDMLRPFVGSFIPGRVNQFRWMDANGRPWPPGVNPNQVDLTHYQRLPPFVIDPIFVARHYDDQGTAAPPFPHFVDSNVPAALTGLQLPRLTLTGLYFPAATGRESTAAADRVFTCQDDVAFFEYQRDARGNLGPDLNSNGALDANEVPQAPIVEGNYSYLVMVTPSEMENPVPTQLAPDPLNPTRPLNKAVAMDDRRVFTVQVVVFHKRLTRSDGVPPAERQILAEVTSNNARLQPSDPSYVRRLAPGHWIMLSAKLNTPPDDPALAGRPIHRWVRITSVGKTPNPNEVLVTFGEPDWQTSITTTGGGGGTPATAVVTIVDDIVGVFERTVELDVRSMMGP